MKHLEHIQLYYKEIITSNPKEPIWNEGKLNPNWNYIDGCMLTALLFIYDVTKEKEIINYVIAFTDQYVLKDGTIKGYDPKNYSADDVSESRILFDLYEYTKDDKYLLAIKQTKTQLNSHPRTQTGIFWHNKNFLNQVWLDGLYMTHPFYARYNRLYQELDKNNDIIHQFSEVRRFLKAKNNLYYHGYDESKVVFWSDKETGLSSNFWLRSIGWHVAALVDTASYFEKKSDDFNLLGVYLKELIDAVLVYKDNKTNLFYQVVDKKDSVGNYLETSGSALISYSILKGVRLGLLDNAYEKIGISIFKGLLDYKIDFINHKLIVKDICLTASLGTTKSSNKDGSVESYVNEPIVENNPKGIAPLLMVYSEYLRLK
ncbi:Putative di-trans,poly-cis-decaprenylcistransferase [Alteracholeplasma palmae J233]|uniref:Putative di-trans,poly-cis-decaprenylcistransferase n=1 Tax=Alteracholeplasma palmae (strain ATCC 49389 / J233) TaxID=1318466 RepID=U4KPY7_ALTPJ|nr:glycoside hydrolase family 88 protein [Alteracholeplasma palmae]CCV64365.1 Putative di-trans,poly-cis-decaprenylcistransferase [Alteracholeplasma palmae J233]